MVDEGGGGSGGEGGGRKWRRRLNGDAPRPPRCLRASASRVPCRTFLNLFPPQQPIVRRTSSPPRFAQVGPALPTSLAMPLDGHAHLVSQGWSGKGTGLRQGAISKPITITQKKTLAGIGKDRDDAFPFWDQYVHICFPLRSASHIPALTQCLPSCLGQHPNQSPQLGR